MQRAVLDAGRRLPPLADPLEVELIVSESAARAEAGEGVWEDVVAGAVEVPSRRSLALLRALESLLPGRPGEWATTAAGVLTGSGIEEPPWLDDMRALTFGECWIGDRSVDAGYLALLCAYAYGDVEHGIVFLLDEKAAGVVRNAFVVRDTAFVKERLSTCAPLTRISAEAAHWLLAKSYDRLDRRPGLPVRPEVHLTRLLARRRIALAFG
ncbi:hypothetical protein [Umezawaea beigongshangensis]|uniref:hypothetical protein n=1 Tax=Umezawaea beigongshangensis TaxID=2780383 RepID=UPI0027DDCCB7|nr:hypothetical protein [Umezawaea beigongshangensis]